MVKSKLVKKKALNCLVKCIDLEMELDTLFMSVPEGEEMIEEISESIQDVTKIKERLKKVI